MPGPKTTDQLAIDVRDDLRHRPHMARTIQDPGRNLATYVRQELPELSRADIAAVLLHAGRWLVHAHFDLTRNPELTNYLATRYAASLPGIAGEHLHTEHQLRQANPVRPQLHHASEFSIHAGTDDDGRPFVYVSHDPCEARVFGGPADAYELNAAELPTRFASHRCAQPLGNDTTNGA